MRISRRAVMKVLAGLVGLATLLGVLWWWLFALKPYAITPEQMRAGYAYERPAMLQAQLTPLDGSGTVHGFELQLPGLDGSPLSGRLLYPGDPARADAPYPVLIGLHALGRSHYRWWHGEHKGGATRENTHRITELALQRGYAVLAVDARNHGVRKDLDHTVLQVMEDLHLWGKREPYERMIVDSVRDYRLLLDWVQTQPQLDSGRINVAGYSMGAQMALLLGGMDDRVDAVLAIVPPHLDDKVAIASPRNAAAGLVGKKVWLLSADDDEYASAAQNRALFDALPTEDKRHVRFAGGHLLPADYPDALGDWF